MARLRELVLDQTTVLGVPLYLARSHRRRIDMMLLRTCGGYRCRLERNAGSQ